MPTKTDRILGHLPGTFRAVPPPTALHTLVDAFGSELQQAENSLAAVLAAHWVDHADRGMERIDDLARLAALYGLAPCSDEAVEAFREHLKRYIRTFLEGPVTVRGILRVTAEALGLPIDDESPDYWWERESDRLISRLPLGCDAARQVLGIPRAEASGEPERPATVVGRVDLSGGIHLSPSAMLHLAVDDAPVTAIPLAGLTTLEALVAVIDDALGIPAASHDGHHLILRSPSRGPASRLLVEDGPDDAAPKLLGLRPRRYAGSEAAAATVTGTPDLSAGVDLSEARYLRLTVDGTATAEVDCAGADPAHTTLDEIRDAINEALDMPVAGHDGRHLTLVSPTEGEGSSLAFQPPAAQDATTRLFGTVVSTYTGTAAQPARVEGTVDLGGGVDLSQRDLLELAIDGGAPRTITCAGESPEATTLEEIVSRINLATGTAIARHDGRFLRLESPTRGAASTLHFATPTPPERDATEILFGIASRRYHGRAATAATIRGRADLSGGVDVRAHYRINLVLDHGSPVGIDLRAAAADPAAATPGELTAAINEALAVPVASHDGRRLILTAPTPGAASHLAVIPVTERIEHRFVSRVPITDEAARDILGFVSRESRGKEATTAILRGKVDLSRGIDLRETPYLRLAVDGRPARDIDCRGPRPRATLPDEIAEAINRAMGLPVARHAGGRVILSSPSTGPASRLRFEPPQAEDALEPLLGLTVPTERRGHDATGVRFVATVDLQDGVDLTHARHIRLGYDDQPAREIDCAGANPAATTLSEIVVAINLALDEMVATHDGRRLHLASPSRGAGSRIHFETPAENDATPLLFGITPPRSYHGRDATAARLTGGEWHAPRDLTVRRYLRLKVDREPFRTIDCAAAAADPARVTLGEAIRAINEAVGADVADQEGERLRLSSPHAGSGSIIAVTHHISGDARSRIFGEVPDTATGRAAGPAVIEGVRPLPATLDLRRRRWLRLALDNRPPLQIDVAGPVPGMTYPTDVVAAIESQLPGCASLTPDGRLRLVSPSRGSASRLAVLPLRHLAVVEYPPHPAASPPKRVTHGDAWSVHQRGAAETDATIVLTAPQGVAWPAVTNEATGLLLRLRTVLEPGEALTVTTDTCHGLKAYIQRKEALTHLPPEQLQVAPPGGCLVLPWPQATPLSRNGKGDPAISLIDPLTPRGVTLRARSERRMERITVTVEEGTPPEAPPPLRVEGIVVTLAGRLRHDGTAWWLEDGSATPFVRLQAGAGLDPAPLRDAVVRVSGPLYPATPPLMVAERMVRLYCVTVTGESTEERYPNVTVGADPAEDDDLIHRIDTAPSALVKAEPFRKEALLTLPVGKEHWRYLACEASRFDTARFDAARFAGGHCREAAVFDLSRFTPEPQEPGRTVFAGEPGSGTPCDIVLRWKEHTPGAFTVHLPADLPARFGGRFDAARFGHGPDEAEHYEAVVTEPPADPDFLITRVNARSTLVEASMVPFVPQGWQATTMPFRRPVPLTLGTPHGPARLYLAEAGLEGFIEVRARSAGEWGNAITLSVRASGPGRFDLAITLPGARFENARHIVLGKEPGDDPFLPPRLSTLLQPGPVGVLQAKAAGIRAAVTRDLTESSIEPLEENRS